MPLLLPEKDHLITYYNMANLQQLEESRAKQESKGFNEPSYNRTLLPVSQNKSTPTPENIAPTTPPAQFSRESMAQLSSPTNVFTALKEVLAKKREAKGLSPLDVSRSKMFEELNTVDARTFQDMKGLGIDAIISSIDIQSQGLRANIAEADRRINERERSIMELASGKAQGTADVFNTLIKQQQLDIENSRANRQLLLQEQTLEDNKRQLNLAKSIEISKSLSSGQKLPTGLANLFESQGLKGAGTITGIGTDSATATKFQLHVNPITGEPMIFDPDNARILGSESVDESGNITEYSQIFMGSSSNPAGVDLAGMPNTPINANIEGEVIFAGENGGWGNQVKVKDSEGNVHQYSHLNGIGVKVGDTISKGTKIGLMGNTGAVMGAQGEALTPEQLASGRGTHLDYTIYNPDGAPIPVEVTARFAGIGGGEEPVEGFQTIELLSEKEVKELAAKVYKDPKDVSRVVYNWKQTGVIPTELESVKKYGRSLTSDEMKKISQLEGGIRVVDQLESIITQIPEFTGFEARVEGYKMIGQGIIGENDIVNAYGAYVKSVAIPIVRAMGEVGNLSETEQKAARNLVPNVTDTKGERAYKMQWLRETFSAIQKGFEQKNVSVVETTIRKQMEKAGVIGTTDNSPVVQNSIEQLAEEKGFDLESARTSGVSDKEIFDYLNSL